AGTRGGRGPAAPLDYDRDLPRGRLHRTQAEDDSPGEPVGEVSVGRVAGEIVEVEHRHTVRGRGWASARRPAGRRGAIGALGRQRRGQNDGDEQKSNETTHHYHASHPPP